MPIPEPKASAARASAVADKTKELTARFGVRPRNYRRHFDAPRTDAAMRLVAVLPQVTDFLNAALKASGSKIVVTEAELATNFMSEGGVLLLENVVVEDIDGFNAVGIDTIVARYNSLKHLLHPSVRAAAEDPKHRTKQRNEKNQEVESLSGLTLEQATYANAGMYAAMAATVEKDFGAHGITYTDLPTQARVFWATVYYNCGEGVARRLYAEHGVDWYKQQWTGKDDHSVNSRSARYNAVLRTANFELMAADLGGPSKGASAGSRLSSTAVSTAAVPVADLLRVHDANWPRALKRSAATFRARRCSPPITSSSSVHSPRTGPR